MTSTDSSADHAPERPRPPYGTRTPSGRSRHARIAVILLATVVFAVLAIHARSSTIWSMEWSVTNWFVAHRTATWTGLATGLSTITDPVGVLVIALIVGGGLSMRRRSWFPLVVALTAAALSAVAVTALKTIIARPRPPASLHLVTETDYGFPSGHSLGTMTVCVALAWLVGAGAGRARAAMALGAAVVLAMLVAASRLYLGVHWVTDVGAAWAVAVILLVGIDAFARRRPAPGQEATARAMPLTPPPNTAHGKDQNHGD